MLSFCAHLGMRSQRNEWISCGNVFQSVMCPLGSLLASLQQVGIVVRQRFIDIWRFRVSTYAAILATDANVERGQ